MCVEVLSPEDRMSRMQKKVADYLKFGVRYVWILDPKTREAFVYTDAGMRAVEGRPAHRDIPPIEIPLSEIFE